MATAAAPSWRLCVALASLLSLQALQALPLDPAALARDLGYDAEAHTAQTDDGHLLAVFRVRNVSLAQHKDPVLVVPGLACNAAIWMLLGPGHALAYLLADRGFDVWLADYRGGMFSRRHANLTDQDAAFWNYSLDEIGRLDVPALLQLVARQSGRASVSYVGHSMGASVLSVMADSPEPRCRDAVRLVGRAYLMAPAAFMGHASQPAVSGSAGAVTSLHDGFGLFSSGEIPLNSWWMHAVIQGFCSSTIASPACVLVGGVYAGHDSEQMNKTAVPFYVQYIPDSISVKNVQHFTQHFGKNGDFRRFDYGQAGNVVAYGRDESPQYNLSRSTFPASIYYGENDFLVNPQDVIEYSQKLPNLVRPPYRIPLDKFSHLDFFLAIDVKNLLYDQVIRDLEDDEVRSHEQIHSISEQKL